MDYRFLPLWSDIPSPYRNCFSIPLIALKIWYLRALFSSLFVVIVRYYLFISLSEMEKPAQIELGDINSPHFEHIFWDICDPLVHYVPFDFGNQHPREPWDSSDAITLQEPIFIDRSNNGYSIVCH